MYGKYKKRVSHVGLEKIKLICSINVTQLVVTNSTAVQNGSVLSICFEKGGKISTSNEIIYDINKNNINPLRTNSNLKSVTIPIDERVELVMTMYKDISTGRYQEKLAKLILRQLKRHAGLGMDGFKSIGVCTLLLHQLVQDVDISKSATKDCTLYLEDLPGCSLSALIHVKFLQQPRRSMFGARHNVGGVPLHGNAGEDGESVDDDDDAVSVGSTVSGGSAFSTLGATFYYNELEEYYGAGEGIVGLSGDVHSGISDSYTFGKPRAAAGLQSDTEPQQTKSANTILVTSPQRRYSGVHVVEAVHQAERKPIRSLLARKSSHISTGSRTDQAAFGSSNHLADANLSDADFIDTARSPPTSPTPDQSTNYHSPPPRWHEKASFRGDLPYAVQHSAEHDTPQEASDQSNVNRNEEGVHQRVEANAGGVVGAVVEPEPGFVPAASFQGEWASVTSAERNRTSSLGSPIKLSSPKALRTRTESNASSRSPNNHNNNLHRSQRTPSHSSPSRHTLHSPTAAAARSPRDRTSAHSSPNPGAHKGYDNSETFALLEKELELRAERIASLEARLELQEQQYRAEMLLVRSELLAAQAEVQILKQAPPPPQDLTRVPSPHKAETTQQAPPLIEVGTQYELHDDLIDVVHCAVEEPLHTEACEEGGKELDTEKAEVEEAREENRDEEVIHHEATQDTSITKSFTSTPSQTHTEAVTSRACQTEPSPETNTVQPFQTDDATSRECQEVSEVDKNDRTVPPSAIAALLSEYGRSAAQVHLLANDLVYYKRQAEEALRAKAEETLAAREAATVAVQACMRRADCEQELEESVYQLRELQRKHARLSIEYEAEVRRCYTLKARLQLYAQKLSALEVDYTLSLEEAAVASSEEG